MKNNSGELIGELEGRKSIKRVKTNESQGRDLISGELIRCIDRRTYRKLISSIKKEYEISGIS